jgi:cobalt-zinc-cadmium efflux system outer membrane protein
MGGILTRITLSHTRSPRYSLHTKIKHALFALFLFAVSTQCAGASGNPTSLQPMGGNIGNQQPVVIPGPVLGPGGDQSQQVQGGSAHAVQTLQGLVTLDQALNQTILTGPRAAAARSLLGIAQAGIIQAKILPNPALEFDQGYAEGSYRVGVALPLEPPWKRVLRVAAARAQLDTAAIQLQQSLWQLRAEIRRAYAELVVSQESLVMMKQFATLTQQLADVATKRNQSGDVPKLDVYKAELAAAQADIDAGQADRRVTQAREQLNIIMGRPEEADLPVPHLAPFQLHTEKANSLLPNLAEELPSMSQYIDQALKERLEVKLISAEIIANRAMRKLTVGNILPNGQISFGWDLQLPSNYGDSQLNSVYLMGSFPIPICDRQQGELARIAATGSNLNLEMNSQRNIIRGQVALAYRKVVNARENMRKYQESVIAQSQKVAELGRLSYHLGQTDITAALNAQQANIQVRNLYLTEVMNYEQAFTDLEQAVGHVLQ